MIAAYRVFQNLETDAQVAGLCAVTSTFGGYAGEAYGKGGELVAEFEARA